MSCSARCVANYGSARLAVTRLMDQRSALVKALQGYLENGCSHEMPECGCESCVNARAAIEATRVKT